jgi:hypothetical protein
MSTGAGGYIGEGQAAAREARKPRMEQATSPPTMPDGTPAPSLLTEEEAIKFLRIDATGVRFPRDAFQRYRKSGQIVGKRIGRCVRYPVSEVMRFVRELPDR